MTGERDRFADNNLYDRDKARVSSAGSEIGGWQLKLLHTTATVCPFLIAGKLGIVSASAGGSICGTAPPSGRWTTDLFSENGATAAAYNFSARSPLPTITTCVCGRRYMSSAMAYVPANRP